MQRLLIVAFVLALPLGARAQIHQPGTQPIGTPGGITNLLQPSGPCHTCHAGIDPADDYEPWEAWRGSLMASAGRDPVFRAAMAIATQDNPNAPDFCVRCHSPVAWMRGRSERPEYDATVGDPTDRTQFAADDPLRQPSDDLDGVACMVCHRAQDPTDANLFNARLVLNDGMIEGERRLGPYSYAPTDDPGHPTGTSAFLDTGRLCGQCHDITNPLLMGHRAESTGLVDTTRFFAIERTFSEWNASAFPGRGQDCQHCHMPEVDHDVQVATFGSFPTTLRPHVDRHYLMGAAAWQLRAIADTIPDADPGVMSHLTDNATRIETFMRSSATVEIRASALAGSSATATIRVTNQTGHKLPTGYPEGRRMWLEVDVTDDAGHVVAGSARYDATTGMLTMDPQARVYEARMGQANPDGSVTQGFHFVLADTIIEDTRIPPEGFAPPADADMAPLGRDYTDGMGGYRHYDEASYSLTGLCGTGTLHLRARLRYQATTREYIEWLRDHAPASTDPAMHGMSWGQVAFDAWSTHGGATPLEIAEATVDLGASPGDCPDAGVDMGLADAGSDAGAVDAAAIDGGAMDAGARDAGATPPTPSGGCCHVAGVRGTNGVVLALGALAYVLARRRRR